MAYFSKTPDIVKIGIWGPPSSGKSTYIVMLRYTDCEGWKIKPRGAETQKLFLEYDESLRDRLEFLGPTAVEVSYLAFDFDGPKGGILKNRQYRVILPEASGEDYEKPENSPGLVKEMSRYQGILWLVDPQRIDDPPSSGKSYRRMIQDWLFRLYELQGGGTLKHYMAFCLTKMDLPNYSKYINDPRNYCLDKLGPDVERNLNDYCDPNRVRFFATSSVGFVPGTKEESNIDPTNPEKLRFPAQPIHLFNPFSWLFSVL